MKITERGSAARHLDALIKWEADASALADIDGVIDAAEQITSQETMAMVRDITWQLANGATSCAALKNIAQLQFEQTGRVSA
jgi:hypothetical protein